MTSLTDPCVQILRGNRQAIDRRDANPDMVASSGSTAAVLAEAVAKCRQPRGDQYLVIMCLNSLPMLDMGLLAAERFAATTARLGRGGASSSGADLPIVAMRMAPGAGRPTGNRRHYAALAGLSLED